MKFADQINNLAAQKNNFAAQKNYQIDAQINKICCLDLRQPFKCSHYFLY
jgi:hypothetical protein